MRIRKMSALNKRVEMINIIGKPIGFITKINFIRDSSLMRGYEENYSYWVRLEETGILLKDVLFNEFIEINED
jgi:hypothetical protein